MKNTDKLDCAGCKISMFCDQKERDAEQGPCGTSLKAVLIAFIIPLVGVVVLLCATQGRVSEGWAALAVLLFLAAYFLIVKLTSPKIKFKR